MKSLSLSRGVRTPSPGPYSFPVVGPAHLRSDSLPAQGYLLSSSPSPPQGVSPLVNRKMQPSSPSKDTSYGSQQLLSPTSHELPDPMSEYAHEWTDSNAYPEMHRLSVAW
jgi:hypothetical protein